MRRALALSRVVAPVAHTSCATHRASCAMSPQTWPFRTFRPPVFLNGQRQCLPLGRRYGLQPCRANRFRHASARNSSIIHLEIRLKLRLFRIRMATRLAIRIGGITRVQTCLEGCAGEAPVYGTRMPRRFAATRGHVHGLPGRIYGRRPGHANPELRAPFPHGLPQLVATSSQCVPSVPHGTALANR